MPSTRALKSSVLALITGAAVTFAPAAAMAEDRKAEHPMPAKIAAIDHDTGVVVVTTDSVPLTLHFPKEHVQDLKTGDTITVFLSFEKGEKQQ